MKTIFLPLALLLPLLGRAAIQGGQQQLLEIYKNYKKGFYQRVIEEAQKLPQGGDQQGLSYYWQGLGHAKLQAFDQANLNFEKARRFKGLPQDFYYEYGQTLFAMDELKEARKSFALSLKKNFKTDTSLYYIAHISQELGEKELAHKYFQKLQGLRSAETEVRQAAGLQLGEMALKQARASADAKALIQSTVLPQWEKSRDLSAQTVTAKELRRRLYQVKSEFGLGALTLKNGRKIPERRWRARFNHETNYDNNVVLEADNVNIEVSNKDSLVLDTYARGSYIFTAFDRFTFTPQLRASHTDYLNSDNANVYQNDAKAFSAHLDNTYEFLWLGKKAATLYEFEFGRTYQDWDEDKSTEFFSEYVQVNLGQRWEWNRFGPTTAYFKYRDLTSYSRSLSTQTLTFNLVQSWLFPHNHLLITTFNLDLVSYDTATTSDNNSYLLSTSYISPYFFWDTRIRAGLSLTFLDTKEQSSTRGLEITYNPSLRFERKVDWVDNLVARLGYAFTKKESDSESFTYTKHEVLFELEYVIF